MILPCSLDSPMLPYYKFQTGVSHEITGLRKNDMKLEFKKLFKKNNFTAITTATFIKYCTIFVSGLIY